MQRREWFSSVGTALPVFWATGGAGGGRQQAFAGPVVSIADHGGTGDGRSDDTAALRTAAAAAQSRAAVLFLPAGTYRLTEPVSLPAPVRMAGVGEASLLSFDASLRTATSGGLLTILGGVRPADPRPPCALADFALTCNSDGPQGRREALPVGLHLRGVSGAVENVAVSDTWGMGIAYHACYDLLIRRCRTRNTGRDGITGFWENTRIWVLENVIQVPGDDGIAVNSADRVYGPALARDIFIHANVIEHGLHFGRGIMLSGVARAFVSHNVVDQVVSSGIAVQPSMSGLRSHDVQLAGNHVAAAGGSTATTQPLVGIRIEGTDRIDVRGNRVMDSGGQGVFVLDSTGVRLADNTVSDWGRVAAGPAIALRASAAPMLVNNVCDGPQPTAVFLEDSRGARLMTNRLRSAAPVLLARGDVTGGVVSGNVLEVAGAVAPALAAAAVSDGALVAAHNIIVGASTARGLPAAFQDVGNAPGGAP